MIDTKGLSRNIAILELWPDPDHIFVWIDVRGCTIFYALPLTESLAGLIESLVGPLYRADDRLPPDPNLKSAEALYRSVFRPLEVDLSTRRLVIIPHGILQALPLELLVDDSGHWLGERFAFSYLPAPLVEYTVRNRVHEPPLLLMPRYFRERRGARYERTVLNKFFPEMVAPSDFPPGMIAGRWIHLSSHFSLHPRFWAASSIKGHGTEVNIVEFFRALRQCELLTLGVCESGNPLSSTTPYWMGFSELVLQSGAQSLLTSRWKLDEATVPLYLAFYRYCRQGFPLDEALWRARRTFLEWAEGRGTPWLAHPFFWAGITYVGWPERVVYDSNWALPFLAASFVIWGGLLIRILF